jgi:hypothetical protein
MPVTMATAITEVRSLLDESNPLFWTDAQIQSWLNQGCEDVARRAENLWQEINIPVTPLDQFYVFPADFLNAHRAEFTLGTGLSNSQQTFNLEFRGINTMDEIWGVLHQLPSAWPQFYTIRGNTTLGYYLMLYPSPGGAGTLTVYYYRQAQAQSSLTGNIDVQPGWEDTVYDYAIFKAYRKAKDPQWKDAFQIYEGKLAQMINQTRNMTDQGDTMTTGVSNWPAYQYGVEGVW